MTRLADPDEILQWFHLRYLKGCNAISVHQNPDTLEVDFFFHNTETGDADTLCIPLHVFHTLPNTHPIKCLLGVQSVQPFFDYLNRRLSVVEKFALGGYREEKEDQKKGAQDQAAQGYEESVMSQLR